MAPRTHRSRPWLLATAAAAAISAAAALASLGSALPALLGWNLAWTASAACAVAGTFAARLTTTGHERRRWTWWTSSDSMPLRR